MSVPIVVDEWLFEDLTGDDREKQDRAIAFLTKLYDICDKIVILEGSHFEEKMHNLMAAEQSSPRFRLARHTSLDLIDRNVDKKYKLTEDDLSPIREGLIPLIGDESDHYLFRCFEKLKNKDAFILTSDGRWKHEKLKQKGVRVEMRDGFVDN